MLIEYKKVDIFQDDIKVLEDVNFHVEEGEFIYLIGKVGSGKTSLLKTLYCDRTSSCFMTVMCIRTLDLSFELQDGKRRVTSIKE